MKYFFSPSARLDLIDIWLYIAEKNIVAADKISAEIESACEILAQSPHLGHSRKDLTKSNVRFWPVHDYLVIYRDSAPLEIVRVLSGFRDIIKLLD